MRHPNPNCGQIPATLCPVAPFEAPESYFELMSENTRWSPRKPKEKEVYLKIIMFGVFPPKKWAACCQFPAWCGFHYIAECMPRRGKDELARIISSALSNVPTWPHQNFLLRFSCLFGFMKTILSHARSDTPPPPARDLCILIMMHGYDAFGKPHWKSPTKWLW